MDWYKLSPSETFAELGSREHGLSDAEARRRLAEKGPNSLPEAKTDSLISIFLRQFASPIIYILLGAATIVLLLGDIVDASIIAAVLFINAIVGAVQEGRAQNTMAALRRMVQTTAVVLRDGKEAIMPSEQVVPGDIIVLREGDKVPADARIAESNALKAEEAALTGESSSVLKMSDSIAANDLPASDQTNMVFRGTYIIGGDARAVVVATGKDTVIGGISQMLESLDTEVPLKASIRKLSHIIVGVVLSVCALIFTIGIMRGIPFEDMFVTAVAVAVSATPEGLPVVVTIVLAAGMYRMSRQNALVRKLQAVEALGQATVIAVDKTGTITLNQMAVEKLWVSSGMHDIEANGYNPEGGVSMNGNKLEPLDHADLLAAGRIAAFTAGSAIAYSEEEKEWKRLSGDPTETALLILSKKIGFEKSVLESEHPRALDIPFSSHTKYHASINKTPDGLSFSVAGAPEVVLENSSTIWKNGKSVRLTNEDKSAIESALLGMSSLGLRVVALAVRMGHESAIVPDSLPELCFVGLAGISDSVRSDVNDALRRAQEAGVKTVMITGDHPETARAIAQKVGIWKEGDRVITGKDLAALNEVELAHVLGETSVFARVAPQDKLKIIEAYRKRGDTIAMTGDGVNDALSLAAADLGVAMGKIGTEVAKEAADIVLLDDSFASIVAAIEEGRNVYRSIKKVILYLFSTSIGEILTITFAMIIGFSIPLLATQILWLNFVTGSFLVISLALEPREKNLLMPSKRKTSLIDRLMVGRILLIAPTMAIVSLIMFASYIEQGFVVASTVVLCTLAVCQWYHTFNCRTERHSVFGRTLWRNKYLLGAIALVVGLQMLAVYAPFMQKILYTTPIGLSDWLIIAGASLAVVLVEEIRKAFVRLTVSK
ncbi:MAG: HAD-IC family P-type ATPase [bacterium]|nr:HAD-IC family P-type ATPase [bacterium]